MEVMLAGESVLLTGPAGSGKTYVLNQFIKIAKSQGKHVSVTATTGLAATHLGGTTLHSWSGIGIADEVHHGFFDRMSKTRRDIIGKTDTLIIDEISMLHDFRFDMVDEVCRVVRGNDKPFGGIQVIMSGDFFQLPPINRSDNRFGGFVTNSRVWHELNPSICYLEEQHRQDDVVLLDILNSIRSGEISEYHVEKLLSRVNCYDSQDDEPVTELHTLNIDVDRLNNQYLKRLDGDELIYTQTTTGSRVYVDALQKSVLAPAELKLKRGAFVMAVKNSPSKKYVNGSLGVVIDFEPATDYPIVELTGGKLVTMVPDTWELRDGDKKRASITQIPLRLAWAITVHKSQGMTLDRAKIDLTKAFVEGMGYVALSRVKNLFSLYLSGINQMALKVSEESRVIDQSLRRRGKDDRMRFEHLQKTANERKKGKVEPMQKAKSSSSWSEKIAKMRKFYPNAYKPWEKQQDNLLKEKFQNGYSVKELSKLLGRHEGSILMRLKKHFGEDVAIIN